MKTLLYVVHTLPETGGFCRTELAYLEREFDRILIVTNDPDLESQKKGLAPHCEIIHFPYLLNPAEKVRALMYLFHFRIWEELFWLFRQHRIRFSAAALLTLLQSFFTAAKFRKTLLPHLRNSPSAPMAYSFWMNNMALGIAFLKQAFPGMKAVVRAHGSDLYFHQQKVGFQPFRRAIAKHSDMLVFISKAGKAYFDQLLPLAPGKSMVSYLGSLPPVNAPAENHQANRPVIVSCSFVNPVKRLHLLVEALKEVDLPLRWVHIGSGPLLDDLKQKAAELPRQVEVEFTGFMPQVEVVDYLSGLRPDLFLNVSVSEGIPVSMMEALSNGIPIMGTDVGGVKEIIDKGLNGFLLPSNPTPSEVAQCIRQFLLLSQASREAFRREARKKWELSFNGEANYTAFARMLAKEV